MRRTVKICTIVAWILLIAAIGLMESARPEMETFLDRRHHKEVRVAWDQGRANLAFIVLIVNLAVCVFGLAVEYERRRRWGVPISRFLVVAALLTLLATLVYRFAL